MSKRPSWLNEDLPGRIIGWGCVTPFFAIFLFFVIAMGCVMPWLFFNYAFFLLFHLIQPHDPTISGQYPAIILLSIMAVVTVLVLLIWLSFRLGVKMNIDIKGEKAKKVLDTFTTSLMGFFFSFGIFVLSTIPLQYLIPTRTMEIVLTSTGLQQVSYSTPENQQVFIAPGNTLPFTNTTGSREMLCLGSYQRCDPSKHDPKELSAPGGLVLLPGQTASVVFAKEGDYLLTTTTSKHADLEIFVYTSGPVEDAAFNYGN